MTRRLPILLLSVLLAIVACHRRPEATKLEDSPNELLKSGDLDDALVAAGKQIETTGKLEPKVLSRLLREVLAHEAPALKLDDVEAVQKAIGSKGDTRAASAIVSVLANVPEATRVHRISRLLAGTPRKEATDLLVALWKSAKGKDVLSADDATAIGRRLGASADTSPLLSELYVLVDPNEDAARGLVRGAFEAYDTAPNDELGRFVKAHWNFEVSGFTALQPQTWAATIVARSCRKHSIDLLASECARKGQRCSLARVGLNACKRGPFPVVMDGYVNELSATRESHIPAGWPFYTGRSATLICDELAIGPDHSIAASFYAYAKRTPVVQKCIDKALSKLLAKKDLELNFVLFAREPKPLQKFLALLEALRKHERDSVNLPANLLAAAYGNDDAIQWMRKNYLDKEVDTVPAEISEVLLALARSKVPAAQKLFEDLLTSDTLMGQATKSALLDELSPERFTRLIQLGNRSHFEADSEDMEWLFRWGAENLPQETLIAGALAAADTDSLPRTSEALIALAPYARDARVRALTAQLLQRKGSVAQSLALLLFWSGIAT